MGDPADGVVEDLSDGKLKPVASLHLVNHGELPAVRRPVGALDVFEDLPGGSAGEWRDGERSNRVMGRQVATAKRDRHLPVAVDSEDVGVGEIDASRFRTIPPRGEEAD